jgi:hypothetical protein
MNNFEKWYNRRFSNESVYPYCRNTWDAALDKVIRRINRMKKDCDGYYQHEDIDFLLDDIKDFKK